MGSVLVPANKPRRPPLRDQVVTQLANTPEGVARAIDKLEQLSQATEPRSIFVVDLLIGDNRIPHGLGRKSRGVNVSPTVCDQTFAYSHAPDGDMWAVITVIGADQPGAGVEIY